MWLLRRGREVGRHEPINWICGHCGYSAPEPVEHETELAKLLREYIALDGRQDELKPKIEELRAKLRAA
jgi:hypothetical protein